MTCPVLRQSGDLAHIEGCTDTLPMVDWIKREDPGVSCKPCLLGLLASWYASELQETGRKDLAAEIESASDFGDLEPEQFCKTLDEVKCKLSDNVELRTRLREFDCTVQNFKEGGI